MLAETDGGTVSAEDQRWMRRALALSDRARTHPNPKVGAIVVRNGQVVGEGWHKGYVNGVATDHAETMAFAQAGPRASGATLYVTLEPCAHRVKSDGTPRIPCAQRSIDAGVTRVVCALEDPDVRVSGRGFQMLRDAGVEVVTGPGAQRARELNRAYIRERTTGLPYIVHKSALTLDGKIAAPSGDARWITGEESRAEVHRMRHRADAILVGIGTVLTDDPLLTTRLPRGNGHDPTRVVLDSRLRLPTGAKVARAGTLVLTTDPADPARRAELEACGVEVVTVSSDADGRVDVESAARFLAGRGLFEVLLESGGNVAASFWERGLVNRAVFFVAPKVIGGENSTTPVAGRGLAQTMAGAVHLDNFRVRRRGDDVVLEGEVKK